MLKIPAEPILIFLCGDVMTGRGIDQILPHPGDPSLHEPFAKSAKTYVEIAERSSGPIPQPAGFSYIWGDALPAWERLAPDLRIANLETSITTCNEYCEEKEVHYRMNPKNMPCLTAARIDCCALANNHVLDWGRGGLAQTLAMLDEAGIAHAGAGKNLEEAQEPAVLEAKGKGRVLVFSMGTGSSGIPASWTASAGGSGIYLLTGILHQEVDHIADKAEAVKRQNDVVVASIHWGGNWGYEIPSAQREFAHALIEKAGVDVVHGHSSHHMKGIEVYESKLILYGCGDFLNDYEGIGGYEGFRDDLSLMYFVSVEPSTGNLVAVKMIPMRVKRFSLHRASWGDALWLKAILDREGREFATRTEIDEDHTLTLCWD